MLSISPSMQLRTLVNGAEKLIASPLDRIEKSRDTDLFLKYLSATAHIIRASTDIMELAADRISKFDDGKSKMLHEYLMEHIAEESGHYEWAIEDLKSASNRFQLHLDETYIPSVLSVPGITYYYIRNVDPWSVLGYISVMEGTPPTGFDLNKIRSHLNIPLSAFRTLELHGDLDVGHADELFDFIERCDLSLAQHQCMRQVAVHTINAYAVAMSEILEIKN